MTTRISLPSIEYIAASQRQVRRTVSVVEMAKAKKNIFPGEAKKIIAKGCVIGVLTADTIS